MSSTIDQTQTMWPSVTIVFLVYNRCEQLRTSLVQMTQACDYDPRRLEVIVVDNASSDGSAEMVRREFPQVRLMVRSENIGVSGWNEGLAVATGDYLLLLDDDCYLPPDGLRRAVAAAERAQADLVSFKVVSTEEPSYVFTEKHLMGLFMFWGCAVLMRRRVAEALKGYDPEIFYLANELEFMLRFYDRGFRHLHLPEVAAQHMKRVPRKWIEVDGYRVNLRNYGYTVAKLLRGRDSAEALVALLARVLRESLRVEHAAITAVPDVLRGFIHGLRHRAPVRNRQLSRCYRHDWESLASPWWMTRPPRELLRALPRELRGGQVLRGQREGPPGRRERYLAERSKFYPARAGLLEFSPEPRAWAMGSSALPRPH